LASQAKSFAVANYHTVLIFSLAINVQSKLIGKKIRLYIIGKASN